MSFAKSSGRPWPIRVVLTAWYTGVVLLSTLSITCFLYYRLDHDLMKHLDRVLRSYASDLEHRVIANSDTILVVALDADVASFQPYKAEFRVFDETGRLRYATPGWGDSEPPALREAASNPVDPVTDHLVSESYPHRVIVASLPMRNGVAWTAQTAVSTKLIVKATSNYVRNMWLVGTPLLIVGVLGGWTLSGHALRPVATMARRARSISSARSGAQVEVRGSGDELDDLAVALNEMLSNLGESYSRIERFSTQLAHELRTPITQLMGETEAALLSNEGEASLRETLARHAHSYARIRSMLADGMSLLRSGVDSHTASFTLVDLTELVRDVAESFHVLADSNGVNLEFEERAPHRLWGRKSGLSRLIGNILDNAIRHTSRGGAVRVDFESEESFLRLVVQDSGVGISKTDLPRVREQFYRGDNQPPNSEGFGLGLSIVEEVVLQHSGSLEISSEAGEGTRIVVTLPTKRPEGPEQTL